MNEIILFRFAIYLFLQCYLNSPVSSISAKRYENCTIIRSILSHINPLNPRYPLERTPRSSLELFLIIIFFFFFYWQMQTNRPQFHINTLNLRFVSSMYIFSSELRVYLCSVSPKYIHSSKWLVYVFFCISSRTESGLQLITCTQTKRIYEIKHIQCCSVGRA